LAGFGTGLSHFTALQEKLFAATVETLTAEAFEGLLEFDYSEEGTNKFHKKQETAFSVSMFLCKLEGNLLTV